MNHTEPFADTRYCFYRSTQGKEDIYFPAFTLCLRIVWPYGSPVLEYWDDDKAFRQYFAFIKGQLKKDCCGVSIHWLDGREQIFLKRAPESQDQEVQEAASNG